MGQYYIAVMISQDSSGRPIYEYVETCGGAKLTEHCYIKRDGTPATWILKVVEGLLRPGSEWYQKSIVWAGDYADHEKDVEDNESKYNLYYMPDKKYVIDSEPIKCNALRYVVNHTKKEYVDKTKVPEAKGNGFIYHPLPLLCAEGNGRGGGDYYGPDPNGLVGRWARDLISMEGMCPNSEYREIVFDLKEGW